MNDQLTELAATLRDRAATYGFLARALSDDEILTDFLVALSQDAPETGTQLDEFAASIAGADADAIEAARKDLAADHASTLLGMSRTPVSPYESAHRSAGHLLMQEQRDQVLAAYRASHFAVEGSNIPEDHVSIELDFMAGLCNRAAAAIERVLSGEAEGDAAATAIADAERDMSAQFDFLEKHLLAWVPAFSEELEKRSTTPFYRGVAQMLREYVEDEGSYLQELEGAEQAAQE